ncbi:electron transport complex protein RnfC [Candidatus Termititenax persephonae]|uniref:Ion-translocating oxidoreductase complex subunit C n=1 Tax=Candidatus Termititenax persephonae TaxID=2218525 RepID=A0A388TFU3_9BACT|nr:electron transport complex protein RnfC [Candidatus Termititenax persephonae]
MPNDYKELTRDKAINLCPVPEWLYVPLSQHIGAPAVSLVKKGDRVRRGQLIGSADAFVTANVHAPVSGEVVELLKINSPQGRLVDAVKIKNDFQDELDPNLKQYPPVSELDTETVREIIREIGLVGLGGAAFPTHVKVSPPQDKKVDTLILNAAECEPYLNADYRILLEHPNEVVLGLRLLAKAARAAWVVVAVEDNKKDALPGLKNCGVEEFARIAVLPSVYPTGAEKILVKKTVGRKIPNKGLPIDVGVVVVNVGTAYQLARSVQTRLPLTERVVTVSGEFANPGNYLVRVGTLYQDVVQLPANFATKDYRVVSGGPMMGFAVAALDVPVTKGTSGIILLRSQIFTETNCLRCARCVDICPLGLLPYRDRGLADCMECGLCAFVCPARKYLVQKVRADKLARQKN